MSNRAVLPRQGITLVELLVVIAIIGVLIGITLPAVQKVREGANRSRCGNNLRQIGLALHHYDQSFGHLPVGHTAPRPNEPHPYVSWMARILPYVEQSAIWEQLQRDYARDPALEPWFYPEHVGMATVIRLYVCPSDPRVSVAARTPVGSTSPNTIKAAFTSYLGVLGTDTLRSDGCLVHGFSIRLGDVGDGTSNTLLVGERPPSADLVFGWWYAGFGQLGTGSADMLLGAREVNLKFMDATCPQLMQRSGFGPGRFDNQCDALHFWSPHTGGGSHFLFADGSVRFISYSAASILPALATRGGGEVVELP